MSGQRKCGDCRLCCSLIPIDEDFRIDDEGNVVGEMAHKPKLTKCEHQCSKGCGIYATRPFACRTWSCAWLVDKRASMLLRPDHGHYLVDVMPSTARSTDKNGKPMQAQVIQVWVDPAYPDAHRAPSLRAYLVAMAKEYGTIAGVYGIPALEAQNKALLLVPPSLSDTGEWFERESEIAGVRNNPRITSSVRKLLAMGVTIGADFKLEVS